MFVDRWPAVSVLKKYFVEDLIIDMNFIIGTITLKNYLLLLTFLLNDIDIRVIVWMQNVWFTARTLLLVTVWVTSSRLWAHTPSTLVVPRTTASDSTTTTLMRQLHSIITPSRQCYSTCLTVCAMALRNPTNDFRASLLFFLPVLHIY